MFWATSGSLGITNPVRALPSVFCTLHLDAFCTGKHFHCRCEPLLHTISEKWRHSLYQDSQCRQTHRIVIISNPLHPQNDSRLPLPGHIRRISDKSLSTHFYSCVRGWWPFPVNAFLESRLTSNFFCFPRRCQLIAPGISLSGWKPQPREDFRSWVNRLKVSCASFSGSFFYKSHP